MRATYGSLRNYGRGEDGGAGEKPLANFFWLMASGFKVMDMDRLNLNFELIPWQLESMREKGSVAGKGEDFGRQGNKGEPAKSNKKTKIKIKEFDFAENKIQNKRIKVNKIKMIKIIVIITIIKIMKTTIINYLN